ncbi:hypothetical protein [Streptococcus infantis]|uniref:hypothetical protein n=1 Tax=Streptococcus infantis TaxID=68892 RepID=UPI0039C474C1
MTKGVKFRSIFYRYVLFIIVLFFLGFNQIVGRGIQTVNIFDYAFSFHQTQLGYFLLLLILVGIGINLLCPWKFSVSPKGIYLRRLALFVPWSDISGVSHVWINKASNFTSGINFYNNKCLVFYRHDYKPICIYNISLLALFAVKLFNPQIKTNILSASFATEFNILLNTSIVFYLYFLDLKTLSFSSFLLFCLLYFIKIFIIPLCLVSSQNSKYGPYLGHSNFFKRNASDVIHV